MQHTLLSRALTLPNRSPMLLQAWTATEHDLFSAELTIRYRTAVHTVPHSCHACMAYGQGPLLTFECRPILQSSIDQSASVIHSYAMHSLKCRRSAMMPLAGLGGRIISQDVDIYIQSEWLLRQTIRHPDAPGHRQPCTTRCRSWCCHHPRLWQCRGSCWPASATV